MEKVVDELSARGLKRATILSYIKLACRLNDNKPFSDLHFLQNTLKVIDTIDTYKISTQVGYYAALMSLLNTKLAADKSYDFARNKYKTIFNLSNDIRLKQIQLGERSDRQAKCWMEWSSIKKRRDELLAHDGNNPTLDTLILSLYTFHPPRRNLDYLQMRVGTKNKSQNYYDGTNFVFREYKTAGTYGEQTLEVAPRLKKVLDDYISAHKIADGAYLLFDGSSAGGYKINRSLKRSLGKTIGSSMLRHIYLTDKYGSTLDKMKTDADAMAHSTSMQREYVVN